MDTNDLGRLLSLISHEVRAPLGVMRGYLRLLEQHGGQLSDQHRQAVTAALRAGERAADLLGQVSALARLQRSERIPALKPALLEPLLRSVVQTVSLPSDPLVTLHVGDTPPVSVAADEELLRGALITLTAVVVRAQTADARVVIDAQEEQHDHIRGVTVTIMPSEEPREATYDQRPLDIWRGGLGLELPIAAWVFEAHHGKVQELRDDDRLVGVATWVPIA